MTYEEHHHILVEYLKSKVALGDWHGVSDAANDLRELEARHRGTIHHWVSGETTEFKV